MIERYRPEPSSGSGPNVYFGAKDLAFVPTGCALLDCSIGGGWPLGRIVNIVGDRSSGKTLLAEEAMANFAISYPKGKIHYRESEAAFDVGYARALGVNTDVIDFGANGPESEWSTLEDIIEDIENELGKFDAGIAAKAKQLRERKRSLSAPAASAEAIKLAAPSLYIIDSLDALSAEAELKRDVSQGSYNLEKQKLLGKLFRLTTRRMHQAKFCLMFISQVRQRIGPMIRGKQYTRTGGKALDFYASVVVYLTELGKVYQTIRGIKRPIGIKVRAKVEKNKIAMPFRECEFEIRFGYGIDDECASLDWLEQVKRLPDAGFASPPKNVEGIDSTKLRQDVTRIWYDIERGFAPPKGKYAT